MVNYGEDEELNERDTDTLANDLEASLEHIRLERSKNPQPPGHPKYARVEGSFQLTPLAVGAAGFARLPGSPHLVKI